jgi:hypothetical protein
MAVCERPRRKPFAVQTKEDDHVTVNEKTTRFTIDIVAAKVAEILSRETGKAPTDALREFMATKTYQLLLNPKSYLFLESPLYIVDMVDAETSGDWDTWLEV